MLEIPNGIVEQQNEHPKQALALARITLHGGLLYI